LRAATGSEEALTSATALRLGDGRGGLGASGASSVCAAARTKGTTCREHVGVSSGGGGGERKREAVSIGKDEASIAAPRRAICSRLAYRLGRCEQSGGIKDRR
jgi:hypothetical protein